MRNDETHPAMPLLFFCDQYFRRFRRSKIGIFDNFDLKKLQLLSWDPMLIFWALIVLAELYPMQKENLKSPWWFLRYSRSKKCTTRTFGLGVFRLANLLSRTRTNYTSFDASLQCGSNGAMCDWFQSAVFVLLRILWQNQLKFWNKEVFWA